MSKLNHGHLPTLGKVKEAMPPTSESIIIGSVDELRDMLSKVRAMLTIIIGDIKDIIPRLRDKPGERFLIGQLLSSLGKAKSATKVNPDSLNFKVL